LESLIYIEHQKLEIDGRPFPIAWDQGKGRGYWKHAREIAKNPLKEWRSWDDDIAGWYDAYQNQTKEVEVMGLMKLQQLRVMSEMY
jgi:nuclear transport factor 2 (NTF2) superfamily protein